jgi:serine/threonine protein kinase
MVQLMSTSLDAPIVAKVGDFGLARHTDPSLDEGLRTWQWLAPEVLNLEHVEYDERSDVYRCVPFAFGSEPNGRLELFL